MNDVKYVTFFEAMKVSYYDDCDMIFHGKEGEVNVLYNAETSVLKLKEFTAIGEYSFFDLTNGLWSIVKDL